MMPPGTFFSRDMTGLIGSDRVSHGWRGISHGSKGLFERVPGRCSQRPDWLLGSADTAPV